MTTDKWDSLPLEDMDTALRDLEKADAKMHEDICELKIARRRKREMRRNDERDRRDGR